MDGGSQDLPSRKQWSRSRLQQSLETDMLDSDHPDEGKCFHGERSLLSDLDGNPGIIKRRKL